MVAGAAGDLHHVTYLYEQYLEDFGGDELAEISTLYDNQSAILDEYKAAYSEDTVLGTLDLLNDLTKFVDLYQQRNSR